MTRSDFISVTGQLHSDSEPLHPPSERNDTIKSEEGIVIVDETTRLVNNGTNRNTRSQRWSYTIGVALAFISGFIFTANNCAIQTMKLDFTEVLFVRSIVQVGVMASVLLWKGQPFLQINGSSKRVTIMTIIQGLLGGLMIICSFSCVLLMPLGDALTLIFSSPLITMILASAFLGHKMRLFKITLGAVLLSGIILVVRPPFLFNDIGSSSQDSSKAWHNPKSFVTIYFRRVGWGHFICICSSFNIFLCYQDYQKADEDYNTYYYIGAGLAGSGALISGFLNLAINYCRQVNSVVLLLWSGLGGLLVSSLAFTFDSNARFFDARLTEVSTGQWTAYFCMAGAGILSYFSMTRALQLIDPTFVAFVRSLEIVLAYLVQAFFMADIPEPTSVLGSSLVILCVILIGFEAKLMSFVPEKIKYIF